MNEEIKALSELFRRDLDKLYDIVSGIPEEDIWQKYPGITNSCGILTQHLVGNLRHFIGAVLGDTGFERDREMEFTSTTRPRKELMEDILDTREMIQATLQDLEENELHEPYPLDLSYDYSIYKFLLHLYGHLNYHLGQVNYLGRILAANKS